jgi:hypothetical protein
LLLDLDNDEAEDEAEVEREGEKKPLIDPRRVVRYSFADTIRGKHGSFDTVETETEISIET